MNFVQRLGAKGLEFCRDLGRAGIFLLQMVIRPPSWRQLIPLTTQQIYNVGVLSAVIIIVSALFIGMVVALQGYHTLVKFGAAQELGQLVALSVVRELGPVVGALLFAGRAGSALTAEIGLMKATEQLDSMEMMAVDPLRRIMVPRFWGGVLALPILVLIFCAIAILGGYWVGVDWLGVDYGSFWNNMQSAVSFWDDIFKGGIIKSIVFGAVVAWISVYQGYNCAPTAAGISRATTRTVVYASLAVLGLDFILTSLMLGGW